MSEENKKRLTKKSKMILIVALSVVALYVIISLYFINHFYFGSAINYVDVAGKTVDEAKDEISSEIENYKLTIVERDGKTESILGSDIGLKYNSESEIQRVKDNQSAFTWLASLFGSNKEEIIDLVNFDESALKNKIDNLQCFKAENIIEPQNPTFEYKDGTFAIKAENKGKKVKKDVLLDYIKDAILSGEENLNLDENKCYETAQYTVDSKEVVAAKDALDKLVKANVTYTFGSQVEVVNGDLIKGWLIVDPSYNVSLDASKVKEYVYDLALKHNTTGRTRAFNTTLGSTVQVSGGSYGYVIDRAKAIKELTNLINEGSIETREPIYAQKGMSYDNNDIGKTYVEINLSAQHLWFYKNGSLVTEGDIVSGNTGSGMGTPQGTYMVNYKESNATLVGEGYSTPVAFWMPFNGGIGMHDATWRSVFGGNIYTYSGSHGCINCPYSLANTIFNNIEAGTPVVCYY